MGLRRPSRGGGSECEESPEENERERFHLAPVVESPGGRKKGEIGDAYLVESRLPPVQSDARGTVRLSAGDEKLPRLLSR